MTTDPSSLPSYMRVILERARQEAREEALQEGIQLGREQIFYQVRQLLADLGISVTAQRRDYDADIAPRVRQPAD